MSEEDKRETAVIKETQDIPPQSSANDTSNQDDKVSVDPSGNYYIRTTDEDEG